MFNALIKSGKARTNPVSFVSSIQNSFDGILKKAKLKDKPGVDKIRFHDLRNTAAKNWPERGRI
jgi:hypothetical protein